MRFLFTPEHEMRDLVLVKLIEAQIKSLSIFIRDDMPARKLSSGASGNSPGTRNAAAFPGNHGRDHGQLPSKRPKATPAPAGGGSFCIHSNTRAGICPEYPLISQRKLSLARRLGVLRIRSLHVSRSVVMDTGAADLVEIPRHKYRRKQHETVQK